MFCFSASRKTVDQSRMKLRARMTDKTTTPLKAHSEDRQTASRASSKDKHRPKEDGSENQQTPLRTRTKDHNRRLEADLKASQTSVKSGSEGMPRQAVRSQKINKGSEKQRQYNLHIVKYGSSNFLCFSFSFKEKQKSAKKKNRQNVGLSEDLLAHVPE